MSAGRPKASPYSRFGQAPDDPLAAMEHICSVLVAQFDAVKDEVIADGRVADRKKKEKARRKELREIARDVKSSMPLVRLYRAEKLAKQDQAKVEGKAGPELEDAPQLDGGGGRPTARRGRPRKR